MARHVRKSTAPTRPLLKAPLRIGKVDTAAVIGQLRQLHEEAEDPQVDRMPDDEELFGALIYLEKRTSALKDSLARRTAALQRVTLWQYLREQADLHQSRAITDARAAGAEWADLMPALAVNTPSAAYNKATRLRAGTLTAAAQADQPVRRTPEAVLAAERQIRARAAAERRAEEDAARRHALLVPVAERLLKCRGAFGDDEDVDFWLDQIEAVLPSCETATQMVSLGTYLEALVRALRKIERHAAQLTGWPDEARLAYAAAAKLLAR